MPSAPEELVAREHCCGSDLGGVQGQKSFGFSASGRGQEALDRAEPLPLMTAVEGTDKGHGDGTTCLLSWK